MNATSRRVALALPASLCLCLLWPATLSAGPMYQFRSFRDPTTDTTLAGSINELGMVTAVAFNQDGSGASFNLLYNSKTAETSYFNVPGSTLTTVAAINNLGILVGGAVIDGTSRGWIRDASGTFSFFERSGFANTFFSDINDTGLIVGGNGGVPFLFDGTTYSTLVIAGSAFTVATGINNRGDVVGYYRSSLGNHGFIRFPDGTITSFDLPFGETTMLEANGINDAGVVVGYDGVDGSFIWNGRSFTSLRVPGALGTFATGINNAGQICGFWFDETTTYGFVATPVPEPSGLVLGMLGVLSVLVRGIRRTRVGKLKPACGAPGQAIS